MTNLVEVSRDRFANKGWKRPKDYTFAASEAVVGLVWSEIPAAALAMPVAFMHQEPDTYVPVALTSPRPGRNVFVAPLGQWLGTYVPFALRTYPFRILRVQDSDQVVLCVDEDSGLIVDPGEGAERFYEPDGSLSATVKGVFENLQQIEADRIRTSLAVAALQQAGVIKPWPLIIPVGEQKVQVNGLYCVDEAALNALDATSFLKLRKAPALAGAYFQMQSMAQIHMLGRMAFLQEQSASAPSELVPT
jgi:SapC